MGLDNEAGADGLVAGAEQAEGDEEEVARARLDRVVRVDQHEEGGGEGLGRVRARARVRVRVRARQQVGKACTRGQWAVSVCVGRRVGRRWVDGRW